MEIAEKDLQREALRSNKNAKLPVYIKTREEEERLIRLQVEESDLKD